MSQDNLIARRDYLINKLRDKTLTNEEAIELQRILKDERNKAVHGVGESDAFIVLGAGILLGLVADYLSKNKNWKKWFK
jgi:hypothetical protein